MGERASRLPWFRFLVVGLLVALDLWSKDAVFARFAPPGDGTLADGMLLDSHGHPRFAVVGEWLTIMLSYNPGAAWGSLGDYPYFLVIGRVIAVLLLAWLVIKTERGQGVMLTALVLVLAGALGNLHDNLFLEPRGGHPFGSVRDFIDVYFGGSLDYHFPTFNVADSCISVGAVLLLVSGLFGKSAAEASEDESQAQEGLEAQVAPEASRVEAGVVEE